MTFLTNCEECHWHSSNCEECHWHSSQTKTSLTLRWKLNRGLHISNAPLSVHAAPNFLGLWFLILRWIKAISSKRFNLILWMACCHKNMIHLHAWFVRNVNDTPHKLCGMSMTFRTNCEECLWHSSQTKTSLTLRWKLNRGLHTSRVPLSVHAAPNFFGLWFLILRWNKATSSKWFGLILCGMSLCGMSMTFLTNCEECQWHSAQMTFLTNENFPYIALKTQPRLAHQQSTPKCPCRTQFFLTLILNT